VCVAASHDAFTPPARYELEELLRRAAMGAGAFDADAGFPRPRAALARSMTDTKRSTCRDELLMAAENSAAAVHSSAVAHRAPPNPPMKMRRLIVAFEFRYGAGEASGLPFSST
jgi:hypothetical protein